MKRISVVCSSLCCFVFLVGMSMTLRAEAISPEDVSKMLLKGENAACAGPDGAGRFSIPEAVVRELLVSRPELSLPKMQSTDSPAPPRRKMHELTLMGSFMASSGSSSIDSAASDIFTGRWSPFFGRGHRDFSWSGPNPPAALDDVIAAAVLKPGGGMLGGVKFSVNILPRIQVELVWKGGAFGLSFTEEAWQAAKSALQDATDTLREYGSAPTVRDDSVQRGTQTQMMGLNVNYNILRDGRFVPYISLGLYGFMSGENPTFDFDLAQYAEEFGQAKYLLMVYYEEAGSFCPNIGVGAKYFFGRESGIKLEARAMFATTTLKQFVQTNFDSDSWAWLDYNDYWGAVADQKINQFIIDVGIGLFLRW